MNRMMDIRNVELSVEDILSIHRYWITKLYLDDHKSETEIAGMLYERRLPVTISQIQNCLSQWDLSSSPPISRRGSSSNNSSNESTSSASEGDWEALRSPSPTSSTSSYYPTTPQNVALYSTRPLPSLPKSASSSVSGPKPKSLRHPKLRHAKSNTCTNTNNTIPTRFANRSPSLNLTRITCHQTRTRSYEVETTLSPIESGLSPIEIFTNDMTQSHERIAVGLRRVRVEYPGSEKEGDEFEWMRQFRDFKIDGKREVKIYQGDELEFEADEE